MEITVEVEEELLEQDNDDSYYRLNFIFDPSGAYFQPPLELKLMGKYVEYGAEVWLYDEHSEPLEGECYNLLLKFRVPALKDRHNKALKPIVRKNKGEDVELIRV